MKYVSITFAVALIQLGSLPGWSAETVRLTDTTTIVFATLEAGQAALQTPDRYTKALSRFDLESRLKTNDDVTADDLMRQAAEQVVAWGDEDRAKLEAIIASVAERLAKFKLPLPPHILLIQTTGKEEGDAAYCRRPCRDPAAPLRRLSPIATRNGLHPRVVPRPQQPQRAATEFAVRDHWLQALPRDRVARIAGRLQDL